MFRMLDHWKLYRVQVHFLGRREGGALTPSGDTSWHTVHHFWTRKAARRHGTLFRLEIWKAKREVWEYRVINRKLPHPPEAN